MRRRTLTPAQFQAQAQTRRCIAPGIWVDGEGCVHFNVPELLDLVQLPNTDANREAVVRLCAQVVQSVDPTLELVRQDPES